MLIFVIIYPLSISSLFNCFLMEFSLEGKVVVVFEHTKGATSSKHVSTDFNLDVSQNLDESHYFNKDGLPNKNGTKALTQSFVQGLIGNIHNAHNQRYWDSAEHLRYIIAELEKGVFAVAKTFKSEFK